MASIVIGGTMKAGPKCPNCGSVDVIPILYGKPTEAAIRESEKGALMLAGCSVTANDPSFYCRSCKKKFGVEKR